MPQKIKNGTPKNVEIYILFLGHWTPAMLHHFFRKHNTSSEIFTKNLAGICNIYTRLLEFAKKPTTQILNPKKIEIYPCQKQKLEQLFFLFLLLFA
jgi:hypothetical protein